ncbi:MAG: hypothetical protein LBH89_00355 [Lactococcus lactis]|jgi:hypothetical protein|nr:hypothetical protein [Lactococcus lactis]
MANNMNELEFLMYGSNEKVEVLIQYEKILVTQKSIAEPFGVNKSSIIHHLNNIHESGKLKENATVSEFAAIVNRGIRSEVEAESIDKFLTFNCYNILKCHGRITKRAAATKAIEKHKEYANHPKITSDFDKAIKGIEGEIKNGK